jgi:hypothetical protein
MSLSRTVSSALLILVLIIIACLLSCSENGSLNQHSSVVIDVMSASPVEIAAWVIEENPGPDLVAPILDQPFERQLEILRAGAKILGCVESDIEQALADIQEEHKRTDRYGETAAASCQQNVEFAAAMAGWTPPTGFWTDRYCDGDPGDMDYVIAYSPSWSDSPNDVRWNTYNYWTYLVLMVKYKGLLLSPDACTPGIRLCVGTAGLISGGPMYIYVGHV